MTGSSFTFDRMVLVLRLDSHHLRRFAEIMLVHSNTELATAFDLTIPPESSTLPYTVVVQTDTRSVIWEDQMRNLTGAIAPESLEAVGDVAIGQPCDWEDISTGLPLRGRFDPRWGLQIPRGRICQKPGCRLYLRSSL